MSNMTGQKYAAQFFINQTDLLAPTAQDIVAPVDGYIRAIQGVAQAAITTGGQITVNINGVAVTGLSVTFANADTKGTIKSGSIVKGVATAKVKKGDRISIVPAAAFDTAGAVNGFVEIWSLDT